MRSTSTACCGGAVGQPAADRAARRSGEEAAVTLGARRRPVFASELKALLAVPGFERLNLEAPPLPGLSIPHPLAIFEGCAAASAHRLVFRRVEPTISRYGTCHSPQWPRAG
jgi:hypothetical protein